MTAAIGDSLFGITILSGAVLCWLGIYCYREWDEPGVGPFAAFTTILGLGAVAGGLVGITGVTVEIQTSGGTELWGAIAYLTWGVATVPWLVFAVTYTGKYTDVSRLTIAVLSLPLVGFVFVFIGLLTGGLGGSVGIQLLVTFATMHIIFLLVIGIYLIVRTTHEYGHLSLVQGGSLAVAGLATFLGVNTAGIFAEEIGPIAATGAYAASYVLPAGLLVFAAFGCRMFESTPAAGTIGEQAIARETEDLLFVVDRADRIIKLNPNAAATFGVTQTEPLGEPLQTVLNHSVDELREMDTYELRTNVRRRQLDPNVSPFTDQHDRRLGYIVSLHDVTDRELRKQRLEVLNRVLRHNLRNSVDVIKANAEAMSYAETKSTNSSEQAEATRHAEDRSSDGSEQADAIVTAADELTRLGEKARSIDRFVSRSVRETERDLIAELEDLLSEIRQGSQRSDTLDIAVQFGDLDEARLVTDWEALTAALESAIENAIEYANQSVTISVDQYPTGYRVGITDDGPGIPDSELATLDAGTETPLQHGSGLGLWQIKWGITKLNGTVTFDTESATTVRMTIPDRSIPQSSQPRSLNQSEGTADRVPDHRHGDGR